VREDPKSRNYCMMALNLSYKSFNEIMAIVNHERKWKNSVADSDTFRFYHISLYYMMVMEICKLMEVNFTRDNNNFASLKRLNSQVFEIFGDCYKLTYQTVDQELEELRESSIFIKLRNYRDKEFAHSDADQNNGPFHFMGLNKSELSDCGELIKRIEGVLNKCLSPYEFSFIIPQISKTKNFLAFHDEYKFFSHRDHKEFLNWKLNTKP
jgi:hypothetical protein